MDPLPHLFGSIHSFQHLRSFLICSSFGIFCSCDVSRPHTTEMKHKPWSALELLPRQLPGNVPPDVIAQLDFSDKTTLVPVIWVIVLLEGALITVVVASRLMVRRIVIGRLFTDDGMSPPHSTHHCPLWETDRCKFITALIVAASLFTLAFCGIILAGTALPSASWATSS